MARLCYSVLSVVRSSYTGVSRHCRPANTTRATAAESVCPSRIFKCGRGRAFRPFDIADTLYTHRVTRTRGDDADASAGAWRRRRPGLNDVPAGNASNRITVNRRHPIKSLPRRPLGYILRFIVIVAVSAAFAHIVTRHYRITCAHDSRPPGTTTPARSPRRQSRVF